MNYTDGMGFRHGNETGFFDSRERKSARPGDRGNVSDAVPGFLRFPGRKSARPDRDGWSSIPGQSQQYLRSSGVASPVKGLRNRTPLAAFRSTLDWAIYPFRRIFRASCGVRVGMGCTLTYLRRPPTMIVSYSFRSAIPSATPAQCGSRMADGCDPPGWAVFRLGKLN